MSGDGYRVRTGALDKAGGDYKNQADVIWDMAARFRAEADLPATAFGNLPTSGSAARAYEKIFEQVAQDVDALFTSLQDTGARLGKSAAQYLKAEAANTVHWV